MRFSAATTADKLLPQRLALRVRPFLGRIDGILSADDERGEAGRMSAIAFVIRLVSAAIAFISQVLLARWMGSFEYGIFVLVWTTMVIAGNVSCLGFHTTVIRFIPEYREKGMIAELRGVVAASRLFVLVASTATATIGIVGVLLLSPHIESYYVVPFVLGFICLPMIAFSDLLQGVSRAYAWAVFALSPTYLVRPVLILVFMALALLLGYQADARTALVAAILATWATTVWQLIRTSGRMGATLPPGNSSFRMREWIAVSLPIFLIEGFFFLLTNADVLMVGLFMQPDDVAVYFATVKTLALVHFVYFSVKAGVAQRYAAYAHSAPEKLAVFARETVAWTFWPSLAMGIIVLALGELMLMLFGPDFVAGYPLLFLLVAAVVIRSTVGPCESLLTMTGNQNICAFIYALTLALNVVLSVILIPAIGLWGAAIATAAAMVFEAAALSVAVWRKLGVVMAIFLPAGSRR